MNKNKQNKTSAAVARQQKQKMATTPMRLGGGLPF